MNDTLTLPGRSHAAGSALTAADTAADSAAVTNSSPPAAAKARRFDMYGPIHKALRQAMAQTLRGLGALDASDPQECTAVLDSVSGLLGLLRSHLHHENDFVHTAIEARQPGGAQLTASDHVEHQEALRSLEDEVHALRHAPDGQRPLLAQRLYRHLAVFIGENLVHMHVEETHGHATLWALYTDEELIALHDRLLASIPPTEMAQVMRWMAAALSVPELAALFDDLRGKAPAPVFDALLGVARAQLDERRWARLARALGQPAVPGLMTA